MKMNFKNFRLSRSSLFLPMLLLTSTVIASSEATMQIDIETDDFKIEQMDISHLAPGDTETIYTDDGKTVDILRTEQGIDIFVDGEKLDLPPSPHADHVANGNHGQHQVMVKVICESEDADSCADDHQWMDHEGEGDEETGAHQVIIIKKTIEEDEV